VRGVEPSRDGHRVAGHVDGAGIDLVVDAVEVEGNTAGPHRAIDQGVEITITGDIRRRRPRPLIQKPMANRVLVGWDPRAKVIWVLGAMTFPARSSTLSTVSVKVKSSVSVEVARVTSRPPLPNVAPEMVMPSEIV